MLWVSIFSPMVLSAEYLYFRVIAPAMDSPRIPAPFVGPDIIVVQPSVAATHVETETIVPDTPRKTTGGKHRAPEPTGTRSIAPAEPVPSGSSRAEPGTTVAPEPTPVPTTTTAAPTVTTTPPEAPTSPPVTTSRTPIYDTLRSETLSTNPSLESVIPE